MYHEKDQFLEITMEEYEEFVSTHSTLEDGETEEKLMRKRKNLIRSFLGQGPLTSEAYHIKVYYKDLLAWTVKHYFAEANWQTVATQGFTGKEPLFGEIQTDYNRKESSLIEGQMFIQREETRLVITVLSQHGLMVIRGNQKHSDLLQQLKGDLEVYFNKYNFYRGKNLSFNGDISFLNAGHRDWNSVILDPTLKKQIRLHTLGFLKNRAQQEVYGIPTRRGIILAGDPGTGKTIILKALISEAEITCLTASAYGMMQPNYICDLYAMAQDLGPSLVFIEDIDFIGMERSGSDRGSPLLIALLDAMDGIEEKNAIVTVATSNCFEILDKALRERPARFDRIFIIPRPDRERRTEIVEHLCQKIPLPADIREYIVRETDNFTPAQIQEIIHSLAITLVDEGQIPSQVSRADVDSVINWLRIKKDNLFGFGSKTPASN